MKIRIPLITTFDEVMRVLRLIVTELEKLNMKVEEILQANQSSVSQSTNNEPPQQTEDGSE